jgi:hypothetical protein
MDKILIVDDDVIFVDKFNQRALKNGFELFEANSLEQLRIKIKEVEHKIGAVILDIKCLLTDDQIIEDRAFISQALSFLDINYRHIPRVILTGDTNEFDNLQTLYPQEKLFLKQPEGFEELFKELFKLCNNSENLKIKKEYSDIFEIFEQGLMYNSQEVQMLNILKNLDEQDSSKFGGILRDIRAMQEAIYKKINQKNPTIIPNDKFKISDGMIEFNSLMAHLNGNLDKNNKYIPTTVIYQNNLINHFANTIYRGCGKYVHTTTSTEYMISNYALKSLIYNLLELMIWAKQYLK